MNPFRTVPLVPLPSSASATLRRRLGGHRDSFERTSSSRLLVLRATLPRDRSHRRGFEGLYKLPHALWATFALSQNPTLNSLILQLPASVRRRFRTAPSASKSVAGSHPAQSQVPPHTCPHRLTFSFRGCQVHDWRSHKPTCGKLLGETTTIPLFSS